jgi:hypothetical protein
MKKINTLNPGILNGIEFNIPLFAADNQMYKCKTIEQHNQNPWKEYHMIFRYVPMAYSVPEYIKMIIRFQDRIRIELYEIRNNKDMFLIHIVVNENNINSIKDVKETFYNLGKSI